MSENKQKLLEEKVRAILKHLEMDPEVEIETPEDDVFEVKITGPNLNALIGFRGYSLRAMETLLNLMLYNIFEEPATVVLDINGYKDQKATRVKDLAKKLIDKVRFFQRDVEMPPMNPWERRQVHVMVGEYDDIYTESTGEGQNRRVVLKPKK